MTETTHTYRTPDTPPDLSDRWIVDNLTSDEWRREAARSIVNGDETADYWTAQAHYARAQALAAIAQATALIELHAKADWLIDNRGW